MSEKEEKIVEALELFCQAMDNAVQVLKHELSHISKAPAQSGLTEESFNLLKWESSKGDTLGEFEVSYKNHNNTDWQRFFNVLKANSSTIANHFSHEGFTHYYWLYLEKYDDRIFRKKKQPEKAA